MRRGDSILPNEHFKRKSRVLPFQHLVMRRLTLDPTTPLHEVREYLHLIIARHGDDIENIPVNAVDEIVAEKRRTEDEVPMEEVDIDASQREERGTLTIEAEQGQGDQATVPSIGSLSRFLRGVTGNGESTEIPVISFKKCSVRGSVANTRENKMRRIEAIQQLRDKLGAGYRWVRINETSWRVGNTTAYGWAKRGDPCFVTKSRGGIMLTLFSAIDTHGVGYCNITTTTSTTETFKAHFRRLIAYYDEAGLRCVFKVDNCSIHNQMEEIVAGSRHCVVFNAAYSPS